MATEPKERSKPTADELRAWGFELRDGGWYPPTDIREQAARQVSESDFPCDEDVTPEPDLEAALRASLAARGVATPEDQTRAAERVRGALDVARAVGVNMLAVTVDEADALLAERPLDRVTDKTLAQAIENVEDGTEFQDAIASDDLRAVLAAARTALLCRPEGREPERRCPHCGNVGCAQMGREAAEEADRA